MNMKSKFINRLPAKADPSLDLNFYQENYADLSGMSKKQLNQHWTKFGKNEGRYPSLRNMLEKNGISNITEFDFELDLDFYLTFYADLSNANIQTLQQAKVHWLLNGKTENRYKTIKEWVEANASAQYIDIEKIPVKKVISLNVECNLSAADVLNVAIGIIKYPIKFFTTDSENSIFYNELGINCYLQCKSKNCLDALNSARSFWRISLHFKQTVQVIEHIGNSYVDQRDYQTAQKIYEQAIALSTNPSTYLIDNLLVCYEKLSRPYKSVELLVLLSKKTTHFNALLDANMEKFYLQYAGGSQTLATANKRAELKVYVKECATKIYDAYYAIFSREETPKRELVNTDKILIIGDFHVPQCIRYRIDQKVEQFELQGKEVTTLDWLTLKENQNEIALHDVVIFYRVPAIPSVLKAMAQVNANGKASFYEIDDLLFEESYPAPIDTFGGYVNLDTHIELRKSMASFYAAAQFCRYGISSTNLLCEKLQDLVIDKKCLLHRNGLDKLNLIRQLDKSHKETVDIFYGSGTQAHNSDFIEQALPALDKILTRYKNVRLIIAGYLQLPKYFTEKYAKQLQQLPPVKNVKAYWSFLEQADINLAVLNDDEINGCKSELKWFEAACFSIPSVVSSTENYRDVLTNGSDAFIASNESEWYDALEALVTQPELRQTIATTALAKVQAEYSVSYLGEQLVNNLNELLQVNQNRKAKTKIALVNVFFPPQSIGGATRVVSDNFDILQKQYGDDFELVVFTSDDRCTTPYQLTNYQHQGVTVYRSTILYRENMDWHPQDNKMYDLFEKFLELEKPDMVHFHCVQRLTASVVEATKDNNIPYIITAHDAWWISDHQFLIDKNDKVYPDGHPDMFAPRVLPNNVSLEESIERITYYQELLHGATHLLTVSESFADIYRKNGYPEIKVNKNGISATVEWLPKNTDYTENVVCALIGGMANHKGYFLLKEAIEQTQPKNIEMLIVDHSK